ncbi:hypothetical protein KCU81_g2080, partial [Aureobasidium melanogenum]|uniref:Uncharacterized protein n=1 Tax=Aureobasidium melanogenum (strain CBS 110374) TaxID=1043003 RepID=A0A074VNW9_AURM1
MTATVDSSSAHAAVSASAALTAPTMGTSYANSTASDAPSLASASAFTTTPSIVANVKPAPEYISLSSASQLATDVADARADEEHSWRLHHRATVAETAVASVNQFLDRQLYEYIGVARSTSLHALKPAVTEVLKKNLARDAIARAEDNLEDLLALQADDEFNDESRPSSQSGAKFNLDFTWKRSRLRVMMRTEKSEFDIDDDERYVREEGLNTTFSETAGVISLASEIFLAGVLDFLGEILLTMASQVALSRIQRAGANSNLHGNRDDVTYVLVDDADLERAVLNSPLDRQWRAWKKSVRMLNRGSQQSHSVASSPVVVRRGSLWDRMSDHPENNYPEHVLASNIPLPENKRDVDEIEVPGLARDPDRPESAQQNYSLPRSFRPQSAGFAAHRRYQSESLAKTRPVSVPLPMTTPLVEAPGAWPTDTPVVEIVDPSSQFAEGQAGEGLPSVHMDDSERPESRDSAHTEKASVSSQPTSLNEAMPAMKVVQRPKRLAIYGSPSARSFNLSQEGLELAADLDRPFSPEDFLASLTASRKRSDPLPSLLLKHLWNPTVAVIQRTTLSRLFTQLQTRARKPTLFRTNSKENPKKDSDTQSVRSNSAKKDSKPVEETRRKTSISRPSPQNLHALPSGQIAREAVMQTESTRDLADFIRSTAPDREPNPIVPGLATSRSLSSIRATAQAQAASARDAPPVPKPSTSNGKYIPRSPAGPPSKRSANRPNLTARAATGSSDNNSDLIDFIRGGPPGPDGKARVPTHIAPFADWDGGVSDKSPNSGLNRPLTSSTSDSRTGLLMNGSSSTNYGSGSTPKLPMSPLTQPGSPALNLLLPKASPIVGSDGRTRSRIKDPYAIPDFSDEDDDEEDELTALPAVPSNSATVAGAERPQAGSMTNMHSAAGRSPALSNGATPTLSPNPGYAPSINSVRSNTSTTAVRPAHITSQISSGNVPRSNKPKMEVRSAGVVRNARLDPFHSSGTSDLADFLMSSGPPEPVQRPAPAPAVGKNGKPEKAEKKKSKFWQRSSSSKNTYVDMP